MLSNGVGYLYARQNDVTLTFNGTCNLDTTKDVMLQQGWNFVGNPFPRAAYVNKPYYRLNTTGNAILITPSTEYISPCYGVFVEAQDENEKVIFSTTPLLQQSTNNGGKLNITLTQTVEPAETVSRGENHSMNTEALALDNAIVSFNDGDQLGKFYFGDQNANIYLPQGDKECAIAYSDKQEEMPVNFKANVSGSYTITVSPEDVEMNYLHLIDKKTGADIDLLRSESVDGSVSYTFTAQTIDNPSRFRLVFSKATAESASDETFAYLNNGNIVILNAEASATLQIIDMTGRVIRNEVAKHEFSISSMPAGVYVL